MISEEKLFQAVLARVRKNVARNLNPRRVTISVTVNEQPKLTILPLCAPFDINQLCHFKKARKE